MEHNDILSITMHVHVVISLVRTRPLILRVHGIQYHAYQKLLKMGKLFQKISIPTPQNTYEYNLEGMEREGEKSGILRGGGHECVN